jgi:hypothetical protein
MHLLIAFAAPLSAPGREALARAGTAWLPTLAQLLARAGAPARDDGDEWSLTPPHERAWARALGWPVADGLVPWAAHAARADGIDAGSGAWALLTPAHWRLGTEQVSLVDPAALALDEPGSRALLDAVRELFTSEGYTVTWGAPTRWYLRHDSLATLPTAALDRVVGRNVDRWLGTQPEARRLRRLQSEVQMVWHAHPLNAEREARGQLPVNSFWVSGSGPAPAASGTAPTLELALRGPALAEDWPAWLRAWEALDAGPLAALLARAERGLPWQLTLAGERNAATWQGAPGGWMRQLRARLARPGLGALLETL